MSLFSENNKKQLFDFLDLKVPALKESKVKVVKETKVESLILPSSATGLIYAKHKVLLKQKSSTKEILNKLDKMLENETLKENEIKEITLKREELEKQYNKLSEYCNKNNIKHK